MDTPLNGSVITTRRTVRDRRTDRRGRPRPDTRIDASGRSKRRAPSTGMAQRSNVTPLSAIVRGVLAGIVGTTAMDALLFARYRKGGGDSRFAAWEFSSGLSSWDQAPAPAQVGRRLVEGLFQRELPAQRAALVNNITHWAYGIVGGVQYGVVAESLSSPRVLYGLPFGASVWATSYVILPAAELYQPIWEYDRTTLAKDLSAHLFYGFATAVALRLLSAANGASA
jgi:Protein of unknown function (DUF1440)